MTSGDHANDKIIKIGQKEEYYRLKKTCCPSNSSGKPLANADVKKSQKR